MYSINFRVHLVTLILIYLRWSDPWKEEKNWGIVLTNKKSCWVGGLCHCPVHGPRTHNKFYKEVNWKKTKRYYWRRRYYLLFSIWFLRPYTFSWRGVVEKDNFGTKQQLAIPPTASSQLFRLRWSNSIKLLSSAPLETAVGKVRRLIIFFSFPLVNFSNSCFPCCDTKP